MIAINEFTSVLNSLSEVLKELRNKIGAYSLNFEAGLSSHDKPIQFSVAFSENTFVKFCLTHNLDFCCGWNGKNIKLNVVIQNIQFFCLVDIDNKEEMEIIDQLFKK